MKNSGFVFSVKEETQMSFILTAQQESLIQSENALAICLVEISSDFKFKFLIEESFRPGKEYLSEDVVVKPN